MELFNEAFNFVGLPPALFSSAVAAGVILRFARGTVKPFGGGWSLAAAVVLGVLAGLFQYLREGLQSEPGKSALAFMAAVLIVQSVLKKLSEKVSWIPKDNEWTDAAQPPAPPPPSQGGFMQIKVMFVLAALLLAALAIPALAEEKSLADPSRLSCGFQGGATWMTARATENDYELTAAVNPSWNLGVLPAVVAPIKIGLLSQQFSWEPKLSVLAYDGTAHVFVQGGYGFYSDLDDDAGIEFAKEPVLSAVLVAPLSTDGRWAIVGNASMRTRSEQRSVSAMLSYLVGGGE